MVDVASLILQRLAIDVIALIKGKDVHIALGESLDTFFFRNPGANVLDDPCALWNVLSYEESLSSNLRRPNTYLNLHRVTFSFLTISVFSQGVFSCHHSVEAGRKGCIVVDLVQGLNEFLDLLILQRITDIEYLMCNLIMAFTP